MKFRIAVPILCGAGIVIFALVCGLQRSSAAAPGSEANVESPSDYTAAIRSGRAPVADVLARLRAKIPNLSDTAIDDDTLYFDTWFAAACMRADDAELKELGALAAKLSPGNFRLGGCFSAFCRANFSRQRQRITSAAGKVEFPPSRDVMPEVLKGAPATLQDAWRYHASITGPARAALAAEKSPQSPAGGDHAVMERAQRAWLTERAPGIWRDLAKCEWRSWCGTGSHSLYGPRSYGILVSFLSDGQIAEAAGASLQLITNGIFGEHELPRESETVAGFLTSLGLDWELLFIGSLLPPAGGDFGRYSDTGRAALSGYDSAHRPWPSIAASGSERGIRLGLDLIRFSNLAASDAMTFFTTALGPEPRKRGATVVSFGEKSERTKPLTSELRRAVLASLNDYLSPNGAAPELSEVLRELPDFLVNEVRDPLTVLCSHRSPLVASRARELLTKAGLGGKLPPPVQSLGPLRFRLLANGEPLTDSKVTVAFEPDQRLASDWTTSGKGELTFPLDEALDPARIRSVTIYSEPSYSSGDNPHQRSGAEARVDLPWFAVKLPVTATQTGLRDVPIEMAQVAVKVSVAKGLALDGDVEVRLGHVSEIVTTYPKYQSEMVRVKPGGVAYFSRLQTGRYRATVSGRGVANVETPETMLSRAGLTLPLILERGFEVRGEAVFPNGIKLKLDDAARDLFLNGKECPIHYRIPGWTGLPAGSYRAVVRPDMDAVPENRHGGAEVEFELGPDSPPIVELGAIKVRPAP